MGYTGVWCDYKSKSGKIDVKRYLDEELTHDNYTVLKSKIVGHVYYAAILHTVGESSERFAMVVPYEIGKHGGSNLAFKTMSESSGPYYFDCPMNILSMLSPTKNAECLAWRRRCYVQNEMENRRKALKGMPVGTELLIFFNRHYIVLTKRSPAYQFKKDWWQCGGRYFPSSRIPCNYDIVAIVDGFDYPALSGELARRTIEDNADVWMKTQRMHV